MATIEDGLYTLLAATAAITALVSTRIYPVRAPQNATLPYIVYQRISGYREITHDGNAGLGHPRFQISAWAKTYTEAKAIVLEVVKLLNGRSGAMGDIARSASQVVNEIDTQDPETGLFCVNTDAMIWHSEAVA